jgi:hypothetical protein
VEGGVADPAAADLQGDSGQRVPEVAPAEGPQRARHRLDLAAPHQAAVEAARAHGQRRPGFAARPRRRPGRRRDEAAHAGVGGQLAQAGADHLGVAAADLLYGQHVRGQLADGRHDLFVVRHAGRRVG